jgi:acetyl esterase/lipase
MKKISFSALITCFALGLVSVACAAQATGWALPTGGITLNLWPGQTPGAASSSTPEGDLTKPDAKPVGGKRVTIYGNVSNPTLTVYQPKSSPNGAAIAVFPGGGYSILAIDLEGTEVCDWLTSRGITCVLVKYRVPHSGPYPEKSDAAMQDGQRAVRLIRSHAAEWKIDPNRIGVLGFSAGAHLAATVSTRFEATAYPHVDAADDVSCRPDFSAIIYPGYLSVPGDEFKASPDLKASPQTPPAFIVQAEDDPVHVENAIAYFLALKKQKVPAELHLYAEGGHGYGLRPTSLPVTEWPRLAEKWFHTIHIDTSPAH